MRRSLWQAGALVITALLVSAPTLGAGARLEAIEVARDLEAIAATGAAAADRDEARHRLQAWMHAAGLERIELRDGGEPPSEAEPEPGSRGGATAGVLTGVLPGTGDGVGERQVVLLVTTGRPGDAGWRSDARAAALVLSAVSELARLPRRHTIRMLVLERDGSPRAAAGRWVSALTAERRGGLLAVVDCDGVAGAGVGTAGPGVVRLAPVGAHEAGALAVAPGWLVHAALAAGRAVGEPLGVAAARFGLFAQLLARSTSPADAAAADAFLAVGVPAVSLGDEGLWGRSRERLRAPIGGAVSVAWAAAWERRLTAMVRRLDVLDGRPRADGQYLGWLGRVWSRRDLYWGSLVAWILLVLGGLPGAWRDRSRDERSALGRRYLPGFAARGLLLVTLLALPVLGFFLLLPGAVAWIAASWLPVPTRFTVALATAPWLAWASGLAWLLATGRAESFALGLPALLLLGGSFGMMLWVLTRRALARVRAGL